MKWGDFRVDDWEDLYTIFRIILIIIVIFLLLKGYLVLSPTIPNLLKKIGG
jgi:hypothetical protein